MHSKYLSYLILLTSLSVSILLTACSTGIESTRQIKMSRAERDAFQLSDEQKLAASLLPDTLYQWRIGKKFLISDDKIPLLMDFPLGVIGASYSKRSLVGDTIIYRGVTAKKSPGGEESLIVVFGYNNADIFYNTGLAPDIARNRISSTAIPTIIDLELVDRVKSALIDKQFWILTCSCFDADDVPIKGEKFVPVEVIGVMPGNNVSPVKIEFASDRNPHAFLYLNLSALNSLSGDSRRFDALFSFTDPRAAHRQISDEVWSCICNGNLMLGMTKEECRLSLGNPTDVNAGHDWNTTIDVWKYKDGAYLKFEDGRLADYRR